MSVSSCSELSAAFAEKFVNRLDNTANDSAVTESDSAVDREARVAPAKRLSVLVRVLEQQAPNQSPPLRLATNLRELRRHDSAATRSAAVGYRSCLARYACVHPSNASDSP